VCSYEVLYTPTDIFMIMEYVAGGELFDHIVAKGRVRRRNARLGLGELRSYVHRICFA